MLESNAFCFPLHKGINKKNTVQIYFQKKRKKGKKTAFFFKKVQKRLFFG